MAPIRALESLTRPVVVRLHTDSKYVLDGVTKWLPRWESNGWQTAGKQPVKDLRSGGHFTWLFTSWWTR